MTTLQLEVRRVASTTGIDAALAHAWLDEVASYYRAAGSPDPVVAAGQAFDVAYDAREQTGGLIAAHTLVALLESANAEVQA